jgi:hypothetical protein
MKTSLNNLKPTSITSVFVRSLEKSLLNSSGVATPALPKRFDKIPIVILFILQQYKKTERQVRMLNTG